MKKALLGIAIVLISVVAVSQDRQQSFYLLSPKHLGTCFRHEIGFTLFSQHYRSGVKDTIYDLDFTTAYPTPVYMRVFSIFSMSYEPQFRLVEFRSTQSLSLDLPLNIGLSLVDLRTRSGVKFDPEPVTEEQVESGQYYNQRGGELGVGHAELGFLLAYNIGQGATLENTFPVGLTIGAGYNFTYAPLLMNSIFEYDRSGYGKYLRWGQLVGRVGFIVKRWTFAYTVGLNSKWISYPSPSFSNVHQQVLVSSYNKFSFSIRLGK